MPIFNQSSNSSQGYLHAGFSNAFTITNSSSSAVNYPIPMNSVLSSVGSDISLNTSNGQITLQPNKRYKLTLDLNYISGQNFVFAQFYNVTTASYFGRQVETLSNAQGGSENGGLMSIEFITPTVVTIIEARIVYAGTAVGITVARTGAGGNGSVFGTNLLVENFWN
jgi:hypothetical protein